MIIIRACPVLNSLPRRCDSVFGGNVDSGVIELLKQRDSERIKAEKRSWALVVRVSQKAINMSRNILELKSLKIAPVSTATQS